MHRLPTLQSGHQLRLFEGGRAFFQALTSAMDRARSSIQLESYIFDFLGDARAVAEALERAALRGVQVWLVVDGVGTGALPQVWADRFDAAGVQWRIYSPLGRLGLMLPSRWRRLHRKLCVVDGETAFCGGINILDDWHDHQGRVLSHPRLDYAVEVQGALVRHVQDTMTQLWWRVQAVRFVRQRHFPEAFSAWRAGLGGLRWGDDVPLATGIYKTGRAALLLRDNLRHRNQIERAYLRALAMARSEVLLAHAYFLPGRRLRQALMDAARRGVRVQLLLQGRREHFVAFHAARMVYRPLLAAGIEIHEFEPSFLHAKVAVVDPSHDRCWATVVRPTSIP